MVKANLYLLLEDYSHKLFSQELFHEIKEKFSELHKNSSYSIKFDSEQNLIGLFEKDLKICEAFANEDILLNTLTKKFDSKAQQKVILFELLLTAFANNHYAPEQKAFIIKVFDNLTSQPLVLKSLERVAEQQTILSQDIAVLLDII